MLALIDHYLFGPSDTMSPPPATVNYQSAGCIAFTSDLDGNDQIYVMNMDGSGLTRLTNNESDDYELDRSPDGTRIAFRCGNNNICVMNADGSGLTRLTNKEVHNGIDGRVAIIATLLDYGAHVSARSNGGYNELHYLVM